MMRMIVLGGVAVLVVVGVAQLFIPPEHTLFARLGRIGGEMEKQWIDARTPAVATQAEEVGEAKDRVKRRTLATQKALETEQAIAQKQISEVHASNWVGRIAANVSTGMCALIEFGGTTPQDQAKAEKYCGASREIRQDLTDSYSDAIDGQRTDVMREMTEKFRDAEKEMAR